MVYKHRNSDQDPPLTQITPLAFYDQSRMGYSAAMSAPEGRATAEWMVGAYLKDGGLGSGGEFALQLIPLSAQWTGESRSGVRVLCFTDATGSLQRLLATGALEAIEALGETVTAGQVQRALVDAGLPDISREPLP